MEITKINLDHPDLRELTETAVVEVNALLGRNSLQDLQDRFDKFGNDVAYAMNARRTMSNDFAGGLARMAAAQLAGMILEAKARLQCGTSLASTKTSSQTPASIAGV